MATLTYRLRLHYQVHAVIRACASSSDGKAPGIYAPTIEGQEKALRRAYELSGIDPATITMVEGHGTGTPVGDAIELTALKNVLGEGAARDSNPQRERVAVGSIKSQIGHLKAVAGCAGMIKVVLALKHKTIPRSINVKEPPKLKDGSNIQDTALFINTRMRPWFTPPGVPRRAGVSSFGFGGANYHCVLEEYEPEQTQPYRVHELPQVLLFSAPSSAALASKCEAALAELTGAMAIADAKGVVGFGCESAFSKERKVVAEVFARVTSENALKRDTPAAHPRVGFVCMDPDQAVTVLGAVAARLRSHGSDAKWTLPKHGAHFRAAGIETRGKVAALFSGQGSQYTHMFDDAAMNWPQVRAAVTAMDAQSVVARPKGTPLVSEVLYPRAAYESESDPKYDERLQNTLHAQPATVAVSVGAFDIMKSAGLHADFAAGHSLGEIAALHAAGALDRDSAFNLVCHRATAMANAATAPKDEAMAAVIGPGACDISPSGSDVWLANLNEPAQAVISGTSAAVAAESSKLASRGFRVVPLKARASLRQCTPPSLAPSQRPALSQPEPCNPCTVPYAPCPHRRGR